MLGSAAELAAKKSASVGPGGRSRKSVSCNREINSDFETLADITETGVSGAPQKDSSPAKYFLKKRLHTAYTSLPEKKLL